MMKFLLHIVLFFLTGAVGAIAQSIKTTIAKDFNVNQGYFSTAYSFKAGDTVEVFGFKKKGKEYHAALQKDDYVLRLNMADYFFTADLKEMKKLPDALSQQVQDEVKRRQANIITAKKQAVKERALQGKVKRKISGNLYCTEGATNPPDKGDSVYVLGYKQDGSMRYYALYNSNKVGVYKTYDKSPFTLDVITDYMPSTDDADVKAELLRHKQQADERREARLKQRREDALNGRIAAVVGSVGFPSGTGNLAQNIERGEAVSILGYKKEDASRLYALCNDKVVGVYKWNYAHINPFTQEIDMDGIPLVDDPAVVAEIERREIEIAAKKAVQDSLELIELKKSALEIIDTYKKAEPAIITVEGWSANSAGGITVDISVRNTSTQTIKYITFNGYFTNPVGDRCHNEIGGGTVWTGKGVGPIGPRPTSFDDFAERIGDCKGSYTFDGLSFYSRTAEYFHLSSVTIQYMSGRTVSLSGDRLKKLVIYK